MVDFREFALAEHARPFDANRILLTWLSDDADRAELYRYLSIHRPVLKFQSRADTQSHPTGNSVFHQDVYLLTRRDDIVRALTKTAEFSNAPYRDLGSGSFMLGLDGGDRDDHDAQRAFASAYLRHIGTPPGTGRDDPKTENAFADYVRDFPPPPRANGTGETEGQAFERYLHHVDRQTISALSSVAFMAAAALPLKQRQFDLVELAEQAAVRFVGFLFGFAQADHWLIQETMRDAYLGLNYQILGRHFVSEPGIIPKANVSMGKLLRRTAELIDIYCARIGREQEDEYDTLTDELTELQAYKDQHLLQPLADFVPILRRIGQQDPATTKQEFSGTELAVIVVGMIAGTIGNVQASVAIAINEYFSLPRAVDCGHEAAGRSWQGDKPTDHELQAFIQEALSLNPPVAFLPRRTETEVPLGGGTIPAHRVVILAMGAATREGGSDPSKGGAAHCDPLIFGGPPDDPRYVHQCVGQRLAMPLITRIVRQVLLLKGLAESLDPRTGKPSGLEKLWGFNCRKYPLEFNRFEYLNQSPLNVIMKVKMPVSEHAEELKKVIKYGAPRIEKKLREAEHVHFAWFEFLENDTKLVLHTVYDGDFDAYIKHFALKIGPMFDLLFEHLQDAPPLPVKKFEKEFTETIRRYNTRPAEDYFFSAYGLVNVSMITNEFAERGA